MCLAEFAALYSTCYNKKEDEVYNDELPDAVSEGGTKNITLTVGYGQMQERKMPAVIRFRKYNKDSDVSNWYRAKLMLYYPWYDEENDLLGGCASYAEHYEQVRAVVIENENKYTDEDMRILMLMMIIDLSMPGVRLPLALKLVMHKQLSKVLRH